MNTYYLQKNGLLVFSWHLVEILLCFNRPNNHLFYKDVDAIKMKVIYQHEYLFRWSPLSERDMKDVYFANVRKKDYYVIRDSCKMY